MHFFESSHKSGMAYPMKLWRFLYQLDSPAIDPYLPVLNYNPEEKVFLPAGLAVLSGDTLAAYLSPEESKIFGLLSKENREVILSTEWRKGRLISLRHVNNSLKYQWLPPRILKIKMKATGYLLEETGATLPLTPNHLWEMEKDLAEKVKKRAEALIKRLQAVNSDPIGLGRIVRAKERQKWSVSYWRKIYPSLEIQVEVDFTITRSGQQN
jgi:spore germination protein